MDFLKKLLVLVTSLLIIGLVIYAVSISQPSMKTRSPQPAVIQPEPSGTGDSGGSGGNQLSVRPQQSDTLRVRSFKESPLFPDEKKSQPNIPRNTPPAVSGAYPSGNPNPIFINAAKRILPAVVSIISTRKVRGVPGDLFHRFFRDRNKKKPKNPEDDSTDSESDDQDIYRPGSGSGIIISRDGYILSNFHVVEGARELRVKLYDKREFYGQFIGGDPTTDVAIIKIPAENLPKALIGNSDSVQIGEWVMAVGNPLNFTSTVTSGIISALGRDINIINEQYRIENFIQTDAVINPGNSGGALVNLRGEVIGMNTAIATRTGLYQGYGFAIPINIAKKVVNDILQYGHVRRGLLGITIAPVTDRVAKGVGLKRPMGAMVQGTQPGFPAAKAGLKQGDIILEVNGQSVSSVNDLQIKIARHHPGEKVKLTVFRDGKQFFVSVELAEAPVPEVHLDVEKPGSHIRFKNFGLDLRELTSQERRLYHQDYGLVVKKVKGGSPAAIAGIFTSELILKVNGKPLRNVTEFEQLIKNKKPGDVLKLEIKRFVNGDTSQDRIAFVEVP